MKIVNDKVTFDDVLLVPQYTEIKSRREVHLETHLTKNFKIKAPLISANMDTVTEKEMVRTMNQYGCHGILHRFMMLEELLYQVNELKNICPISVSVGISDFTQTKKVVHQVSGFDNVRIICIDVAHGDCKRVIDLIKYIKQTYQNRFDVIAGNVVTPEATNRLCEAGVDAVKIGVGSGALCSTRIITGCGFPQLSAIIDCVSASAVPIIADGGIRNSGDVVKALAAGASSVMVGSLFAATTESPGPIERLQQGDSFKEYKLHRGMASRSAMESWKPGYSATPEGESMIMTYKGGVGRIVEDLLGGIRSGMTYNNASNLEELRKNVTFVKVTDSVQKENVPHALKRGD